MPFPQKSRLGGDATAEAYPDQRAQQRNHAHYQVCDLEKTGLLRKVAVSGQGLLALPPSDVPSTPTPGEQLRSAIRDLGLSQGEAADALGVTRQTVSSLINGRQQLSKKLAPKIDTLTRTPPGYWMNLWRPCNLDEPRGTRIVGAGEHLKLEMKRRGLSQSEIGKAIAVSRQSINNIVNNRQAISRAMSRRLSSFMELPSDYWMRDVYMEKDLASPTTKIALQREEVAD